MGNECGPVPRGISWERAEEGGGAAAGQAIQILAFEGGGALLKEGLAVNAMKLCFVAGTPILMGDGSTKPIEQLKKGDEVIARDETTGKTAVKKVESTTVKHALSTVVLTFVNHEKIETTKDHPFYVEGKGFVKASELGIGNSIVTRAGPAIRVLDVKWHEKLVLPRSW